MQIVTFASDDIMIMFTGKLPEVNSKFGMIRNFHVYRELTGKCADVPTIPEFLERRRRHLGYSQTALANESLVSEKTVRNYESEGLPLEKTQRELVERYTEALGINQDGLNRLLDGQLPREKDLFEPVRHGLRIVAHGRKMPASFDLGIAASGWVELEGEGNAVDARSIAEGWVVVRIRGDSMEPRFRDGERVMFRLLNADDGDLPQVGVDYFFVRNDGRGTFKRLVAASHDEFVLIALNQKYQRKLSVARQEIVMMAEARFEIRELPEM